MTYPGQCDDCPGRSHALCCRNTEDQRPTTTSEVARLMQRITTEHEAAQRGMVGITSGTARHAFIAAHMERMGTLKDDLAGQIGEHEALTAICQVMLSES